MTFQIHLFFNQTLILISIENSEIEEDTEEDELIADFGGKVDTIELWLRLELIRESKQWLPMRVR